MKYSISKIELSSKRNIVPIRLCLIVPNPLGLESVEECMFYDEFCKHINVNDTENNLISLRYLRDKIDEYVYEYQLYCDVEHTIPMMYIIM